MHLCRTDPTRRRRFHRRTAGLDPRQTSSHPRGARRSIELLCSRVEHGSPWCDPGELSNGDDRGRRSSAGGNGQATAGLPAAQRWCHSGRCTPNPWPVRSGSGVRNAGAAGTARRPTATLCIVAATTLRRPINPALPCVVRGYCPISSKSWGGNERIRANPGIAEADERRPRRYVLVRLALPSQLAPCPGAPTGPWASGLPAPGPGAGTVLLDSAGSLRRRSWAPATRMAMVIGVRRQPVRPAWCPPPSGQSVATPDGVQSHHAQRVQAIVDREGGHEPRRWALATETLTS